jgi:hypothetical protein
MTRLIRLLLCCVSLLCIGCSKSSLSIRVQDEAGAPMDGVLVKAHGGPYFADARGIFGVYDDSGRTNSAGEVQLNVRVPLYCHVELQTADGCAWHFHIERDFATASNPIELGPSNWCGSHIEAPRGHTPHLVAAETSLSCSPKLTFAAVA